MPGTSYQGSPPPPSPPARLSLRGAQQVWLTVPWDGSLTFCAYPRAHGLCLRPLSLSLRPGPEQVAKLQRAPAATTCDEIPPDCYFSAPGSEQRQVRLLRGTPFWFLSPLSPLQAWVQSPLILVSRVSSSGWWGVVGEYRAGRGHSGYRE